jgi:hypothetical protein
MNKSKLMITSVVGVFFLMNTVSASANPLLVGKGAEQVFRLLFKKIGKEAAEKAMKKALREAGENLTYKSLERVGREAAEKAVINANVKLTRKFLIEGGERLSYKALSETHKMLNKAAVEALASGVKNEFVREASKEVLEMGGRKTLSIITSRSGIPMYLTKNANNLLTLTTNEADAILLTPEMIEKYSVYLQKVFQTVNP